MITQSWDNFRFPELRTKLSGVILALCLLFIGADRANAVQDDNPTKDKLISSLSGLYENIEKGDLDAASKFVVMLPEMKPTDLAGLIDKRELSKVGVAHLAANAKFGSAIELFGEERANHFASKMKVDVGTCFAFNHTFEGVTAEAIGMWIPANGPGTVGYFKLVRVDDIGKLPSAANSTPNESAESQQPADAGSQDIPDLSVLRYPLAHAPTPSNMSEIAMQMVELEKTVKANPEDVDAQANYSQALYLIRSYPKAWEHLMTAYQKAPNHVGIQKGIDAVFDSLTLLGAFTAEMPKESVVNLLGEPHKIHETKMGERLVYAYWVVQLKDGRVNGVFDLRGASEELFWPTEIIDVNFEKAWRPAFRNKQRTRAFSVMYTDDKIMNNATEQITVERILGGGTSSIKDIIAKLQSDGEHGLKTRYKVLQSDDGSAIIASNADATKTQPARHSLVKIMKGEKDLHRLTYTVLSNEEPTRETQMKWLDFFQTAKLLPVE